MTGVEQPPWELRAECASGRFHRDAWSSAAPGARALALHACRTHCPVRKECRRDLGPLPGMVAGGTAWSLHLPVSPVKLGSSTEHCPRCRPGAKPWMPGSEKNAEVRSHSGPECGTRAGWAQHRRRGDEPCRPCDEANRTYHREHRARRRREQRLAAA